MLMLSSGFLRYMVINYEISNYSIILKRTYNFALLISGNRGGGGHKTLFKKERIRPAGLMIPEVFEENVGPKINIE